MPQAKCSRCREWIFSDDTIAVDGDQVFHADCRRPQALSHEERVLLLRYCWDHPVAGCLTCARGLRQQQLASDVLGLKTHLCAYGHTDLTENVRAHIYECTVLPVEVRLRARAARDAARRLVKQSSELTDRADVLMREAEAAIAALRDTMRRRSA